YYYSRAQAHTYAGQYGSALPDYLEVIALAPNLGRLASGVFLRTADTQARVGNTCEAASTIRMWMSASPEQADSPQGKKLIADYEGRQPCQAAYAAGRDSFTRQNGQTIQVSVEINGRKGMFIVDTGATFVALTKDFAERARISFNDGKSLPMQTVNGKRNMKFAQANRIQVGKISANQVPVVVDERSEKTFGPGIDGLLGQSFLSRFDIHFGPRTWTISVPGNAKPNGL
ncbi:MAG: retroviral-like aspartic protease family protein, partial [Achromobacter pestifer]